MKWLADFQRRFGDVLLTPLEPKRGHLGSTPHRYGEAITGRVTSVEGLEVYQRQYWFRLLAVLGTEFPLTARVLGPHDFQARARAFLLARPPRGIDIHAVADGFESYLMNERGLDAMARQAAAIDEAWRLVWRAPEEPIWRPTPEEAQRLAYARLRSTRRLALVQETWPLVTLRHEMNSYASEVRLPDRLPKPQDWAILLVEDGITSLRLDPLEARLLRLLEKHPLNRALADLEADCPSERKERLPLEVQAWLARGMELGFWCGLR